MYFEGFEYWNYSAVKFLWVKPATTIDTIFCLHR